MSTPVVSVYAGIKNAALSDTKVLYVKGSDLVDKNWPTSELHRAEPPEHAKQMIANAVAKVKTTDAVFALVGGNSHTVGESRSRTSLDLPGATHCVLR